MGPVAKRITVLCS